MPDAPDSQTPHTSVTSSTTDASVISQISEAPLPSSISCWFDPTCPWTWITSRWLVDGADAFGVEIDWRTLSLASLNAGKEMTERFWAPRGAAWALQRVFESMRAEGSADEIGPLYESAGRRFFVDDVPPTPEVVADVLRETGADRWIERIDDTSIDDVITQETRTAIALAGPDVGSPILSWGDGPTAIFGPIVSPAPRGSAAADLLRLVVAAAETPGFFELKRGRTVPPDAS